MGNLNEKALAEAEEELNQPFVPGWKTSLAVLVIVVVVFVGMQWRDKNNREEFRQFFGIAYPENQRQFDSARLGVIKKLLEEKKRLNKSVADLESFGEKIKKLPATNEAEIAFFVDSERKHETMSSEWSRLDGRFYNMCVSAADAGFKDEASKVGCQWHTGGGGFLD